MKRSRSIGYSRYFRTSWKLSASTKLDIPEFDASVHMVSKDEAITLESRAQRSNSLLRRPYSNPFYLDRILSLGDRTVIEIIGRGYPSEAGEHLNSLASLIETATLLSSVFFLSRSQFQKCLAIDSEKGRDFDIAIGPRFQSFRSRSIRERHPKGILIDSRFVKRFHSNGFVALLHYCKLQSDLAQKVLSAMSWLLDSRQEPRLTAGIVKTSIAIESLLIFNDNEPLARSLSERCAYLLSAQPENREKINAVVRAFYDARSGVVHGGRRKSESISPRLLEAVDRLVILASLVLAANEKKWLSKDDLRNWCEYQKWDSPDKSVTIPFSNRHLQTAILLAKPK